MSRLFNEWLENKSKIILFDGGMGTEIIKRGISPGKLPDLLNIEEPDVISEIHGEYYSAGSDMVQTNTFGASMLNLQNHKLESRIEEINKKALENIKRVCPSGKLIVGDIGPSGIFRPPIGKATIEQWQSSFKKQAIILEDGVNVWHVETISDIEEMIAAIRAIKQVSTKPIISSMTYKRTKRGFFTVMGDPIEKCVEMQETEGASVMGANCTLGSEEMIDLAKELINHANKPVSIKPNAGKPRLEHGIKTVYDQLAEDFARDIKKMIDLGVKIVGGCCGTSPETIKAIKMLIQ